SEGVLIQSDIAVKWQDVRVEMRPVLAATALFYKRRIFVRDPLGKILPDCQWLLLDILLWLVEVCLIPVGEPFEVIKRSLLHLLGDYMGALLQFLSFFRVVLGGRPFRPVHATPIQPESKVSMSIAIHFASHYFLFSILRFSARHRSASSAIF